MDFPDLSAAKYISIDTETHDEDLKTLGPGTHRGAYIAGFSVGTPDGYREYFPIAHEGGGNCDRDVCLRWANDQLSRPGQPKVGANLLYDLEFLENEGVHVEGPFLDVQLAEPLLNEHRFDYTLEALAKDYLGEHKSDQALYEYCAEKFGGKPKRDHQIGKIWKCPGDIVRPYGIGDVDLPLRILEKQLINLKEQSLEELFQLECSLLPLLLKMRQQGVRVDVEKAERLSALLKQKIEVKQRELDHWNNGKETNFNGYADIAPLFDNLQIVYPTTPKSGKPSFTDEWLDVQEHPAAKCIADLRRYSKIKTTFIDNYIIQKHVNGRIYGQFHQLKSDRKGTISGRFSSSNPNLENIPSRDEETVEVVDWDGTLADLPLGKAVRSLYLPEEDEDWVKDDYSQVEYRIICHYGGKTTSEDPLVIRSTIESANAARRAYIDDPDTDFHKWVAAISGLDRKIAKNLNFGKSYGMGPTAVAGKLKSSLKEAREFIATYDGKMPFIKELLAYVAAVADQRGYIKTILGRRARFDLWEPKSWGKKGSKPLPYEQALKEYGRALKRAKTYKALNSLSQGTAADIIKKALSEIWKAGICNVLHAPRNLVHDEIDWSKPRSKEATEAHREAVYIMENCIKLSVPLIAESEIGNNWGEVEKMQ